MPDDFVAQTGIDTVPVGGRELTGRVIIRPLQASDLAAKGKGPSEIAKIRANAKSAVKKLNVVKTEDALDYYVVEVPGGKGNEKSFIARFLKGNPNLFEYAEPDYMVYPVMEPNDYFWNRRQPSGGAYPDQQYLWHHYNMNSSAAWDVSTGSPDVVVAICDTGLLVNHPDLDSNRVEGYNAVDERCKFPLVGLICMVPISM